MYIARPLTMARPIVPEGSGTLPGVATLFRIGRPARRVDPRRSAARSTRGALTPPPGHRPLLRARRRLDVLQLAEPGDQPLVRRSRLGFRGRARWQASFEAFDQVVRVGWRLGGHDHKT